MKNGETCWLVGQTGTASGQWELSGLFATEEEAVAACRDRSYFVRAFVIGEQFPHETIAEDVRRPRE